MAFLKISTIYIIGNDNSELWGPARRQQSQVLTYGATTVDLFIFGTAEMASSIVAASMPILRLLFQRSTPSPKRVVEMAEEGRLKSAKKSKDTGVVSL